MNEEPLKYPVGRGGATLRSSFEPASPALDSPTTSDLERETVRKLRTKTGWYNGDQRALDALRMFEARIVERERNLSNAIHAPNS